ncbi:MAG: hypothetical protein IT196_13180 [Acidimicrobiales bacterium]|nr:hypothetical protein [Acidimicrobiales bacterium]
MDAPLSIPELMQAVDATSSGSGERLAALIRLAEHPCAWHAIVATEVWAEISDLHRQRQDWDLAIAAWEQTIRLGYRSAPHPRAQIAELLVLAGRRDEGDALYAQLHDRYPHDVWLPNSAALTYLDVADWTTALQWTDIALELTINNGDQAQLIGQLSDMRSRALTAMGRAGDDDLGRRIATFVAPPRTRSTSLGESWGEVEPHLERCENCGAQPEQIGWIPTDTAQDFWAPRTPSTNTPPSVTTKVPRNPEFRDCLVFGVTGSSLFE